MYFENLLDVMVFLVFGKSRTKWRQRLDMTIAVDWDFKHKLKQTKKSINSNKKTVMPIRSYCCCLFRCTFQYFRELTCFSFWILHLLFPSHGINLDHTGKDFHMASQTCDGYPVFLLSSRSVSF